MNSWPFASSFDARMAEFFERGLALDLIVSRLMCDRQTVEQDLLNLWEGGTIDLIGPVDGIAWITDGFYNELWHDPFRSLSEHQHASQIQSPVGACPTTSP